MNQRPLVSVGVPTFNRATALRRALDSVLGQDYPNLELIISDNASTDGTEALCKEYGSRDPRVRYIRQTSNQGMNLNFKAVLAAARGEFFMWLGDDDWLDRCYISRCVELLNEQAEFSVVCGASKCFQDGQFVLEGEKINLLQNSGQERLLTYYHRVIRNGLFFSLMRREMLAKLRLANVLGGDWHLLAEMAFMGKVRTLDDVFVNRELGGESRNMKSIVQNIGMAGIHGEFPNVSIAISAIKNVLWQSRTYRSLGIPARLYLAVNILRVFNAKYYSPYWKSQFGRIIAALALAKNKIFNSLRLRRIV